MIAIVASPASKHHMNGP